MEHNTLKKIIFILILETNLIYRFELFCLFIPVLVEQVAVALYCILTGSCSSQTKPISSIFYRTHQQYLNIYSNIYLSCLVVYSIVLYHIMTRADTA